MMRNWDKEVGVPWCKACGYSSWVWACKWTCLGGVVQTIQGANRFILCQTLCIITAFSSWTTGPFSDTGLSVFNVDRLWCVFNRCSSNVTFCVLDCWMCYGNKIISGYGCDTPGCIFLIFFFFTATLLHWIELADFQLVLGHGSKRVLAHLHMICTPLKLQTCRSITLWELQKCFSGAEQSYFDTPNLEMFTSSNFHNLVFILI